MRQAMGILEDLTEKCRPESPKLGQVQSRERCGARGWPTASPCFFVWARPRAPSVRSIVPPTWAGGALPLADVCSPADMSRGLPAGARQGVERSILRLGQPEGLPWGCPREHMQRQRAYRQAWPLFDPPPAWTLMAGFEICRKRHTCLGDVATGKHSFGV